MSFQQEKYDEIQNLGGHNWKLVETREVDTHFGNAYATFDNGEIRLRFTCDRGSEMVDVGPSEKLKPGSDLYPLEVVLATVDENFRNELLNYYAQLCQTDPSSEDWSAADNPTSLLYAHWGQVSAAFNRVENLQNLEITLHAVQNRFLQALDDVKPEADYEESISASMRRGPC